MSEVANDSDAGTGDQELWLRLGRYTYSAFAQQMFGMEITNAKDPVIEYIFGNKTPRKPPIESITKF